MHENQETRGLFLRLIARSGLVLSLALGLLLFAPSVPDAPSATWDTAPRCPIGVDYSGEPLPIGCVYGHIPMTDPQSGRTVTVTSVASSNPAVLDVRIVTGENDRGPNSIKVLTVGAGQAEICYTFDPIPLSAFSENTPSQLVDPSADPEAEDAFLDRNCTSQAVSPELAMNCMAAEMNEQGFEVTTNHIHQGCVINQGWASPSDTSVPRVTAAWSSDDSILRVSPQNGTVRVEAVAPGKATYCYTRDGRPPQLGTGPFCWSLVVHARTVDLARFSRAAAEPVCNFSQDESTAYVHMGCRGQLIVSNPDAVTSSDPSIVALDPVGWTAVRLGQSRVCFDSEAKNRCIDFTVFQPNESLPEKSASPHKQPSSPTPSLDSVPSPDGSTQPDLASEVVGPGDPALSSRKGVRVKLRETADRYIIRLRTKRDPRSWIRVTTITKQVDDATLQSKSRKIRLNRQGNLRIALPLDQYEVIRITTSAGKNLARITW